MHRFITFACAVTAATLLVVGCGSDSDDSSAGGAGSGGSGGSGGGNSSPQCVGVYANLTQATLKSTSTTDGQCAADVNTICSNDVTTKAESCGLNCLEMGASDMDSCVSTCLNGTVTPALSAGCASCYATDVGCARDHCKLPCLDPAGDKCKMCREQNGCIATFYSCSGLPLPSLGAGGAPDMPTNSAGAGG